MAGGAAIYARTVNSCAEQVKPVASSPVAPISKTTTTPEITPSAPGPALDMETSTTMDTNAPSGESLESFLESVRVDALRANLSSIQNSSDYLSIAIFAENKLNCLSNFMFPDINVSNNISVDLIKIIEEARLKFSILKHQEMKDDLNQFTNLCQSWGIQNPATQTPFVLAKPRQRKNSLPDETSKKQKLEATTCQNKFSVLYIEDPPEELQIDEPLPPSPTPEKTTTKPKKKHGPSKKSASLANKQPPAPTPVITAAQIAQPKGLGIRDDPVVHERDQAMEIFKETVEFENGRYIVQLPFRKSYNEFSDNYSLAKQRFQGLWRRFGHDSELYQQYREIILDYSEQGIIEEVKTETTDNELKRPVYYLPHQAVYRFNRVNFGVSSSPFLLAATIRNHIEKYKHEFPDTVELLDRSFYVDDLISGGNEFEEALQTSRRAKYVMEAAGMDLRKWITNDTNLMEQWKKENFDVHPVHETVSLGANETKVLGLSWNSHEDYLTTDTKSLLEFVSLDKNTKRFILQAVGKIFDPLGLISPFSVRMKCLLQDLWKEEIQWDDPLPTRGKNGVKNFPT
ncbi:uncharacterized protein NPIL_29141 [Nephila pilipes]|uniref:Reverse transcriptase domain-containing protein n=1 Tax=Nephila pilipes TaxID=299642 RepID=A0A8X6TL30_NEPPI|nr:uncharacterized protein NPIL_29141 [Nephila pilipes]